MGGSLAEIKEASIFGPVAITTANATTAGYETGTLGVFNYTSSTTVANAALPTVTRADNTVATPLRKRFIRVFNRSSTAICDFAFGFGAAPALTYAPSSPFGASVVAAGAPIGPQSYQDFIVPDKATHVAWILETSASSSVITIWCAEGTV